MSRRCECPVCGASLDIPRGVKTNSKIECPSCLEQFVPPQLRMTVVDEDDEPYDPLTADSYDVKKPVGKKVRPKVKAKSQMQEDDENWKPQRSGGPEIVLLVLGVLLGLVIPLAYLIGKWAITKNVGIIEAMLVLMAVVVGLFLIGVAFKLFRRRSNLDVLFGRFEKRE
jgi:hypothetical protein